MHVIDSAHLDLIAFVKFPGAVILPVTQHVVQCLRESHLESLPIKSPLQGVSKVMNHTCICKNYVLWF